ncbi:hypothetical protein N2152v2_001079 [Parachlorella kessleri]
MASVMASALLTSYPLAAQARCLNGKTSMIRRPLRLAHSVKQAPSHRAAALAVTAAAADAASTVKIIVQGRHMPVTPALKEYAENKVGNAVNNFSNVIREVDVRLEAVGPSGKAKEAHHQRDQAAEVTIYTHRYGVVRAEEVADDCYAAIDLVCDKLKRKMRKVKERAVQKSNWPGRGGPKGGESLTDIPEEVPELPAVDAEAPPLAPEIVREKIFLLEQMDVETALEQIENVGHDFYVFLDKTNEIKIIYRRKAHGYGIIIPAIAQ